jgi:hypothetical protein
MIQTAAKFVPCLLNDDQQQKQLSVCKNLQDQTRKDRNFLSKVITGDESWVYGYDEDSRMSQRLKLYCR